MAQIVTSLNGADKNTLHSIEGHVELGVHPRLSPWLEVLRKFPEGRVRLSPLFDFALMKIDAFRPGDQNGSHENGDVADGVVAADSPAHTFASPLPVRKKHHGSYHIHRKSDQARISINPCG